MRPFVLTGREVFFSSGGIQTRGWRSASAVGGEWQIAILLSIPLIKKVNLIERLTFLNFKVIVLDHQVLTPSDLYRSGLPENTP